MPYAIRLLFALLIGGYYYLPTNRSFADNQVVMLTEDGGVDGSLVGELNLGEVKGGSTVELNFAIKNPLNTPFVYNRVRPSCSCTSVTVVAETLEGGGGGSGGGSGCFEVTKPGEDSYCRNASDFSEPWSVKPRQLTGETCTIFEPQ